MNVIEKLIKYQKENRLSDLEMAEKLTVCRQLWQKYRSDPEKAKNTISPVHYGILQNFPQLENDLIEFIRNGKSNGNN